MAAKASTQRLEPLAPQQAPRVDGQDALRQGPARAGARASPRPSRAGSAPCPPRGAAARSRSPGTPAPSISSRMARDIATNASASRSQRLRRAVAPRASRPAGPPAHALPHVQASPLSSPFVSGCITTGTPHARAATRPGRPSTRVPRTTRTSWPGASRTTARTAAGSIRNFPVRPGPGGRHPHDTDAVHLLFGRPGRIGPARHHGGRVSRRHERRAEPPDVGLASAQDRVERLGEEEDAGQRPGAARGSPFFPGRRSCTT